MKKTGKKTESKGAAKNQKEAEDKKEEKKKVGQGTQSDKDPKGKLKKKNKEEKKEPPKEEPPKKINFKLDFIYRREKYTLNLLSDNLVSRLKKMIGKKIEIDEKILKFYYKEKELKEADDKLNVYEMIKDDPVPFIDVKKESVINQDIASLNSKVNLIFKVQCSPVTSYIEFVNKIEQFFKDLCIENHYLCEPTGTDSYDVCFACSDHCFQFKRYMMNVARTDKLYEKTKFIIENVEKQKKIKTKKYDSEIEENPNKIEKIVVKNKKNEEIKIEYKKMKHRETDYFQKDFVNVGPYESYEQIKKRQEKEDKDKWISKKNFSVV